MPEFTYAGPGDRVYTESKDAHDRHLGLVVHGDIRELDEAPDHMWHPATDEDRSALAARSEAAADAEAGEDRGEDESGPPVADELTGPDGEGTENPQPARTGRKRTQPDDKDATPDA
jgi:hypothetical protein